MSRGLDQSPYQFPCDLISPEDTPWYGQREGGPEIKGKNKPFLQGPLEFNKKEGNKQSKVQTPLERWG